MDWKKLVPWNWFKEEEVPARTTALPAGFHRSSEPFAALRTEMEQLFDDQFRRTFLGKPSRPFGLEQVAPPLQPSVDISEGKKAYTIRAELPGVEAEDVSIEVEDNTLILRAEKRQEVDDEKEGYHCIERSYGAMQRVLSLPDDADGDAIEATFRNGMLKLKIPKHPVRASKSRSIEIEAG
jgi:HSP20 family protein